MTGKIVVIGIVVGILVIEVRTTIGAFEISGEHVLFNALWFAIFGVAKGFLDILPKRSLNNRVVNIFMNLPVFLRVIQAVFQLIGFAVRPKVYDVARIHLICKDLMNDADIPKAVTPR